MDDIDLEDILSPEHPIETVVHSLTTAAPLRDPTWHKFETDIRYGLETVKRSAMDAIRSGKQPKKISVAWVLREAGRGRSQFYAAHADFEARISLAQAAVERLLAMKAGKAAKPAGKTALADENRVLKARIKELEGREISQLASIAFERAFPRDVVLLTSENGALKAEVARLQGEAESLRSYIRSLALHQDIPEMKIANIIPFTGQPTT